MMRMGRAGPDVADFAAKWIGRGAKWAERRLTAPAKLCFRNS
jgi:hypothetical protein